MNIYVSLTSIYQKQHLLLLTLQSILLQTLLPTKCFIYLSEEPYLIDKGFKNKKLNDDLQKFIDTYPIFKIRWCKNIGPYRKLLYLLKSKWNRDCLILTIDDDIVYHRNLIESYVNDYKKYKCCVSYRGCTHDFNFPNYSNFHYEKRTNTIPRTLYNFANSGVGTIIHPSFFHKTKNLIFDLKLIKDLCPTTDDIWYYFCRIANNIDTVIINKPHFFQFFNDNDNALFFNYNNVDDRNTVNIKKTATKFHQLKLI